MCERTFILEFTFSKEFKISAHLCFVFHLVLSYKIFSFLLRVKMLLGFLYCSFLVIFVRLGFRCFFSRGVALWKIMLVGAILLVFSNLSWSVWVIVKWFFVLGFFCLYTMEPKKIGRWLAFLRKMVEMRKAILSLITFSLSVELSLQVVGLLVHDTYSLSPNYSRIIFNVLYSWHKLLMLLYVAKCWQRRLVGLEILIHLLLVPCKVVGLLWLLDLLIIYLS
jgi:hypothetical protein